MRKQTVLPLQDMNNEFMMVLNQKKIKLVNEDTTPRRNPDPTSVIYLTTVKLAQHRQVDENRIEKET